MVNSPSRVSRTTITPSEVIAQDLEEQHRLERVVRSDRQRDRDMEQRPPLTTVPLAVVRMRIALVSFLLSTDSHRMRLERCLQRMIDLRRLLSSSGERTELMNDLISSERILQENINNLNITFLSLHTVLPRFEF